MTDDGRDLLRAGIVLGALLLVLSVLVWVATGMAAMGGMMGGPWDHGMPEAVAVLAWVVPFALFVALVVVVAVAVAGTVARAVGVDLEGEGDAPDDEAIETLRLAYARGELDDEEFDRRLERLRGER